MTERDAAAAEAAGLPELIQKVTFFVYWTVRILSLGLIEVIPQCPFPRCGKDLDLHGIAHHVRYCHIKGGV